MTNDIAARLLSKIMEKQAEDKNKLMGLEVSPGFEPDQSMYPTLSGYSKTVDPISNNISRAINPMNWLRAVGNVPSNIAHTPYNIAKTVYGLGETAVLGTPARQAELKMLHERNTRTADLAGKGLVNQGLKYGLGAGAGVAGIMALRAMMQNRKKKKNENEINVPYPVARDKEAGDPITDAASYVFGLNQSKPSVWDNPFLVPSLVAGTGAAMYGGYKGTKYLTDAVLAKNKADEKRKAEREFNDTLLHSYDKPLSHDPHRKRASEPTVMEKVGQELDVLFDLVKTANPKDTGLSWTTGSLAEDALKGSLPMYMTYALASGLGAGALGYDMTRKNSKADALKKALRERARAKYEQSPPELHAIPNAVDLSAREKRPSSVV